RLQVVCERVCQSRLLHEVGKTRLVRVEVESPRRRSGDKRTQRLGGLYRQLRQECRKLRKRTLGREKAGKELPNASRNAAAGGLCGPARWPRLRFRFFEDRSRVDVEREPRGHLLHAVCGSE